MLVARVELWRQGNPHDVVVLDTIVIANDTTGTTEKGNYSYAITHEGATSRGFYKGWDRGRPAIDLLAAILKKEGYRG